MPNDHLKLRALTTGTVHAAGAPSDAPFGTSDLSDRGWHLEGARDGDAFAWE